jgi:hypothetical protein
LRFGEENDYLRMFCGFGGNSDPDNSSTRGGIMETIEILALIVAILGVVYIGIDAIFDRMGM